MPYETDSIIHMKKAAVITILCSTLLFASSGLCMELVPWISVGGVTDTSQQDEQLSKVGVMVRGYCLQALCAELSGSYSEYSVRYFVLPYGNAASGVLAAPVVTENRTDWSAVLSYPIKSGDFGMVIRAGYRGAYLDNSITSFDIAGPVVGINAEYSLAVGSIEVQAGYTPITSVSVKNRLNQVNRYEGTRTISIFGDPRSMVDYRLVFWQNLQNAHRLGIGFEGESMYFQRTERHYYGLAAYYAF